MAVATPRWLIDRSALARVHLESVADVMLPRVRAGEIGIALVTELEVGFSARSTRDYSSTRESLIDHLVPVPMSLRAEQRAREVQALLVERGHHRAVSVPDLLVAAIAEMGGLTVLHYDGDFEHVAGVTGQAVEWVVPRGSVD